MSLRLLGLSLTLLFSSVALAQSPRPRQGTIKVGEAAPTFRIKDVEGKQTTDLAALKGKPVVLIFGSCT